MANTCRNCRHGDLGGDESPCRGCTGFDKWEPEPPPTPSTEELLADQRRLEWLLTVMSLEDDQGEVGGPRTAALGAALMLGKTGRDAIDFAMEGSP